MEVSSNWIDVQISRGPLRGDQRGKVGLVYRIKARADVEDYIKAQAGNAKQLVEAVSDQWTNVYPSNPVLEYYDAEFAQGKGYSLINIGGTPLITGDVRRRADGSVSVDGEVVNLAFLRLAGISGPEGVTLGFAGAYSREYLDRLTHSVPVAIKRFLEDYIVPVTINLSIVSRRF